MPERFWSELARATERALLVDFDGTLAPFHPDRELAFPYPEARDALQRIVRSGRTRLVVVSGRHVADLPHRLDLDPTPELWGCHGFERRWPDGRLETVELGPAERQALEHIDAWTRREGLEERTERKPSGRALHWRGLDEASARDLREHAVRAWEASIARTSLEMHRFDGGLEVRPAGHDKGDAVRGVLSEMRSDTAAAYLGDDLTDEDAFRAIAGRGLGVLVRPELRATAATAWIRPPDELVAFLTRWHDLTTRPA